MCTVGLRLCELGTRAGWLRARTHEDWRICGERRGGRVLGREGGLSTNNEEGGETEGGSRRVGGDTMITTESNTLSVAGESLVPMVCRSI